MITFYQCLQEFIGSNTTAKFSNKQLKRVSNYCKHVYDTTYPDNNVEYVESIEPGGTFTVRAYPVSFKKFILDILKKVHANNTSHIQTIAPVINNMLAAKEASEAIYANQLPAPREKRKRRIILIAPTKEYSAKPVNK